MTEPEPINRSYGFWQIFKESINLIEPTYNQCEGAPFVYIVYTHTHIVYTTENVIITELL